MLINRLHDVMYTERIPITWAHKSVFWVNKTTIVFSPRTCKYAIHTNYLTGKMFIYTLKSFTYMLNPKGRISRSMLRQLQMLYLVNYLVLKTVPPRQCQHWKYIGTIIINGNIDPRSLKLFVKAFKISHCQL